MKNYMFNNCKCENPKIKAINKLIYPKPSVTADIVISRRNKKTEQFLFIVRKNEPFKGNY